MQWIVMFRGGGAATQGENGQCSLLAHGADTVYRRCGLSNYTLFGVVLN